MLPIICPIVVRWASSTIKIIFLLVRVSSLDSSNSLIKLFNLNVVVTTIPFLADLRCLCNWAVYLVSSTETGS